MVTSNLATNIELIPPAISPTKIPSAQAMMIHINDSVPVVSLLFVITQAATSAAALEIETIDRSIPPVSVGIN